MRAARGSPHYEESRHDGDRDGFDLNSILAGADDRFDRASRVEAQAWAEALARSVVDFRRRQLRRQESERIAIAALRKAVRR